MLQSTQLNSTKTLNMMKTQKYVKKGLCVSLDLLLKAAFLQQFIRLVHNKQTDTCCQQST